MRTLLLVAVVACRAGEPAVDNKVASPAAAPKFAIKDPKVLELLHGRGSAGDAGFGDYTTDDYVPDDGTINRQAADRLETCAYAEQTETDRALRGEALACMTRLSTGLAGPPTPLRANIIARLDELVDHEADPELRRTAVFALAIIVKDYAPDPKLRAKLNELAAASVKTDPEFAALAWIPSTDDNDSTKLSDDERELVYAILAADTPPHVYDLPFAYAPTLDQQRVCTTVATLLRPDAKSLDGAITYVLQTQHCPTLRDAAVDMIVAKFDDEFRTAGVIDKAQLTPAQLRKLKTAAVAFRARTKNPQEADLYIQDLLH